MAQLLGRMPGVAWSCRFDPRTGTSTWIYLDATAAEFYDVPADELRADPAVVHRQIVPEDRHRLLEDFEQNLVKRDLLFLWNGRIARRSGEVCWIETQTRMEYPADGTVLMYTQGLDVTWRKQLEEALSRSEEARKTADEQSRQVLAQNITLQRELEIERSTRNEQLAASEEAKIALIDRLRYSIDELSNPILEVWDDVLVMPIVGVVDSRRTSDMVQRLLTEVTRTQASFVIIDLTGVEIVDTKTADHLMKLMRKVEVVGARCVLTGIRAAVAETLVDIGVDFGRITTLRNLKHGLREALRFARSAREVSRDSDFDDDRDLDLREQPAGHKRRD
jgi:anti-anti-sigma regulatory factor